MPSVREQVLTALYTKLKALESSSVKVYRNLDKPQKLPSLGIIIVRDGTAGDPEVLLSPLTYIYEHSALLEIMTQHADAATRDSQLDSLLASIGGIIAANRSLDNLAEWMEARAPEFLEEPIEGAATVKSATVPVMIRFFTSNPLT